jgi:MFS family permease
MSEPAPLSRNRDFNVFWAGQAISALGDAFAIVAAPLLVLQATGSVASMGRFSAIVACAYVASGLVAGSIVDRVDRRRLMIFCDLGRTAVYLATPLVWWLRGPSYPVLLASSAVGAFLGNIFQVAAITAVANLVPRAQLIEANGRMHGAWAAMFFVGPMLAGELCLRVGAVVGFAADAASFLLSALSVTLVRGRFNADTRAAGGGARADFALGFRFLWREPVLRATAALLAGCALLMGGRENLLVFYVKRGLRGDDRAVGVVFALAAVGAMVAAALTSRLRRRFGYAASWLAAGALMGAAVVAVGRAHTVAAVAALAGAVGFAETLRGINTMTLRQEVTPDHMLGRVTAVFWTLLTFPAALGAELSGRLAERFGVPATLSATGAAMLVLIGVGTRTAITQPVPRRVEDPAVAATS